MLPRLKGSYGADSPSLARDRAIVTDPEDTKRRRTIRLTRDAPTRSWGFTLQTYGIRNKKTSEVEVMSYVDYVELHGPAWVAGMRRGDIILSVNGDSVECSTHVELVQRIKQCKREMRLVVLFENCCKKVELHERYLKLKKLLGLKLKELKCLEEEEHLLSQGVPPSQISAMRRSTSSSISIASEWDAYSEIISPSMLNGMLPNQFVFRNGVDSDTSSGSIVLDSSFSSDKGHKRNSGSVPSSSFDSRSKGEEESSESDAQGFGQSSQSDVSSEISANSEEGLKHMYNITRCAVHIAEACKCTHVVPITERTRCLEETSKDDSSMTNLVEDCGVQMRAVKATSKMSVGSNNQVKGIRSSSSVSSSSSSPSDRVHMKKFYMESDSEDSVVSGADTEGSLPVETSLPSCTDSKLSGSLRGGQNVAFSGSVLEKDEDEVDNDDKGLCQVNSFWDEKQNSDENQHNNNINVSYSGVPKELSLSLSSGTTVAKSSPSHSYSNAPEDDVADIQTPTNVNFVPSKAVGPEEALNTSWDDSPSAGTKVIPSDDIHVSSGGKQNSPPTPVAGGVDSSPGGEVGGHVVVVDYHHIPKNNEGASSSHQLLPPTTTKSAEFKLVIATSSDQNSIPGGSIPGENHPVSMVNVFQQSEERGFGIKSPVQNTLTDVKSSSAALSLSSASTKHTKEPEEGKHSSKRIVDGILVNDENQSTRL